jgi:acetoacetate decarboxylase
MPVFAPLFTPGTERVEVRWLTVEAPVDPVVAARCLPAGLEVPEAPEVGLWIAEFIGAEFHSPAGVERRPNYLQGGVSLRCSGYGGGPDGAYAIETFVEGLNHGILGRELFGLPKKQALTVRLEERGDAVAFGIVSALGEELVSGEAELVRETDAVRTVPAPAWFERHCTVKAIPSADGSGYDVCKLVEIPWRMTPEAPPRTGSARFAWGASRIDPLHVFAPTGPASASYGRAVLDIGYGRYLAEAVPPEPLGRPSWTPAAPRTPHPQI